MVDQPPKSAIDALAPSVYVLAPAGPIPHDWDFEVRYVGIRPERIASFSALKVKVDLNPELILVLRYGKDEELGIQLLTKILNQPELHSIALVVVGQEAQSLEAELTKVVRFVVPVEEPCSAKKFLDAIQKAAAAPASATRAAPKEKEPDLTAKAKIDFAGKLFDYLRTRQLDRLTLGGQRYVEATKAVGLAGDYIEADSKESDHVDLLIKGLNPWLRNHVYRSGYMTDRILIGLGVSDEKRQIARLAAMLRVKAFADKSRLLRSDYDRSEDGSMQRAIAETLRLSARYISEKAGEPRVSSMVSLCACYFEGLSIEAEDSSLVSTVLITDLIERSCWNMGFFNSLRAYMILKNWRSGRAPELDFGVICLAAKFLSEGIVAVPFKRLLPKGVKAPKRDVIDESKGVFVIDNGRLVPVEALNAGMRLMSPLLTYDGREILQSDIQLDDDLIWRIWQLASIRPIRNACIAN